MAPSLCGGTVSSRRGLLASLWSLVTVLTLIAFVFALIFSHSRYSEDEDNYYYQNNAEDEGDDEAERDAEIAVTSRAMAFAALWTAVLAALLSIFGTVVLGWQSPTGVYYTCCAPQVHRTTPLALGSFIGALLMFANLTLVCSVLFGEFEVSFNLDWRCAFGGSFFIFSLMRYTRLRYPRFGTIGMQMIGEKGIMEMWTNMLSIDHL